MNTITLKSKTARTLEEVLEEAKVDLSVWEVDHFIVNKWDCTTRRREVAENWQIKVWLRRRVEWPTAEQLIRDIKRLSKPRKRGRRGPGDRRALEVCLFDPHMGLHCFPPGSDHAWGLEDCEKIFLWALDELIEAADMYGPIEEVVLPFGNDFMHADNVWHETTGGTSQPEAESWHHTYSQAVGLAVQLVDTLRDVAPVQVYQIPGNHDRQTSYTLGHMLNAYYRLDEGVRVDHSSSPYKFHRYGCNLIGYEHGHSVDSIRLAALMANECREHWAATSYREWHLGDQHRKGSSRPSAMEEQGVSVEYLPGLTAPNEWHRLKAFNWQKRGAMAFVWDYRRGPIARLQVNLDSYTGRPTGERRK